MNKLLTEYPMAYKNRISILQADAQDDLFWFTCKVMASVQIKYNLLRLTNRNKITIILLAMRLLVYLG